jgi:hypothetical protein
MVHAVATVVRAVSYPVSADIEAGYGTETFYGFGEAEALFSQRPSLGEKAFHAQAER